MGITVFIACITTIAVVAFQVVFTMFEAKPYKKVYYQFLLKLSKAPNDSKLKKKAVEAGNNYYNRIKSYGMGSFRGAVTSVKMNTLIGP